MVAFLKKYWIGWVLLLGIIVYVALWTFVIAAYGRAKTLDGNVAWPDVQGTMYAYDMVRAGGGMYPAGEERFFCKVEGTKVSFADGYTMQVSDIKTKVAPALAVQEAATGDVAEQILIVRFIHSDVIWVVRRVESEFVSIQVFDKSLNIEDEKEFVYCRLQRGKI